MYCLAAPWNQNLADVESDTGVLLPGSSMKSETSRYKADGPLALILAPTRELVVQIAKECDKFGKDSFILSNAIFGGVPKGPQVVIPLCD